MGDRLQVYHTDELIVSFDPTVCIHSARCIGGLPAVFDVSRPRWIALEAAPADEIVATVAKCPSGALRAVQRGRATMAAATGSGLVEVTVRPNGPLLVKGPVRVMKESGEVVDKETCAFCRCGGTKTAPFCDGTHNRIGFRSPS